MIIIIADNPYTNYFFLIDNIDMRAIIVRRIHDNASFGRNPRRNKNKTPNPIEINSLLDGRIDKSASGKENISPLKKRNIYDSSYYSQNRSKYLKISGKSDCKDLINNSSDEEDYDVNSPTLGKI